MCDAHVYKIWIRTSCALGAATSTSSTLTASPAAQHTAALHFMTFPAVSDIRPTAHQIKILKHTRRKIGKERMAYKNTCGSKKRADLKLGYIVNRDVRDSVLSAFDETSTSSAILLQRISVGGLSRQKRRD